MEPEEEYDSEETVGSNQELWSKGKSDPHYPHTEFTYARKKERKKKTGRKQFLQRLLNLIFFKKQPKIYQVNNSEVYIPIWRHIIIIKILKNPLL